MKGKKGKWWLVLIPAVLVLAVLAVLFGSSILIYIAPKVVLTNALTDAASRLEERFQNNPVRAALEVYDREGKYTAVMELDTSNELLGDISYDMTVRTDAAGHQLFAEGVIGFSQRELTLSAYMGSTFMAISSPELVKGSYYGITYDTFLSDLDSFPLVKRLIPEETLEKWDASLEDIQAVMNRPYEVPEVTQEDIRALLTGLLAMKCQVEKTEHPLDGETVSCHMVTCGADGAQVKELLGYVLDVQDADTAEVSACFYLYRGQLIEAVLDGSAGEDHIRYILTLGEDPGAEDLTLKASRTEDGVTDDVCLKVSTQENGETYAETLVITKNQETPKTISYEWDTVSGDMVLNWDDAGEIQLNLTAAEDGVRIVTEDFAQLMDIMLERDKKAEQSISCAMTLSKGAAIQVPEYKNMDQWSLEDLVTLLGGIGALVGIG